MLPPQVDPEVEQILPLVYRMGLENAGMDLDREPSDMEPLTESDEEGDEADSEPSVNRPFTDHRDQIKHQGQRREESPSVSEGPRVGTELSQTRIFPGQQKNLNPLAVGFSSLVKVSLTCKLHRTKRTATRPSEKRTVGCQ